MYEIQYLGYNSFQVFGSNYVVVKDTELLAVIKNILDNNGTITFLRKTK